MWVSPHSHWTYHHQSIECTCVAEAAQQGDAALSSMPDFADADKATAWQKLTHLQQHMLGLITAVEGQLRLSHSPSSAHEQQAAGAEHIEDGLHNGRVLTPQQDSAKPSAPAVVATHQDDAQLPDFATSLEAHTGEFVLRLHQRMVWESVIQQTRHGFVVAECMHA